MIIVNFINELGNRIKIKVKRQKDVGENFKTKEKIKLNNSVSVAIIGPTSMSENIITRMEAEELYAALGRYLNDSA